MPDLSATVAQKTMVRRSRCELAKADVWVKNPRGFPSVIGDERTLRGRVREKECQMRTFGQPTTARISNRNVRQSLDATLYLMPLTSKEGHAILPAFSVTALAPSFNRAVSILACTSGDWRSNM